MRNFIAALPLALLFFVCVPVEGFAQSAHEIPVLVTEAPDTTTTVAIGGTLAVIVTALGALISIIARSAILALAEVVRESVTKWIGQKAFEDALSTVTLALDNSALAAATELGGRLSPLTVDIQNPIIRKYALQALNGARDSFDLRMDGKANVDKVAELILKRVLPLIVAPAAPDKPPFTAVGLGS